MMKIISLIATGAITLGTVLSMGAAIAPAAASASPGNFAGYRADDIDTGIIENSITANWVEPKAIHHGYHDAYAAFLVGFTDLNGTPGGFEPSMPQIGTEVNSIGGIPRYYAWSSPPPGPNCGQNCGQHAFRNSVRPGDHMSASAVVRRSSSSGDHYTLKLTDVRYRRHRPPLRWTRTVHRNIQGDEAEGITVGMTPVPTDTGVITRLADFSPMHFNKVKLNGYVLGSFANVGHCNYVMIPHLLAKTSSLGSSGDRFSVTWKRSR